jgi:hypothetical protein
VEEGLARRHGERRRVEVVALVHDQDPVAGLGEVLGADARAAA